MLRPVKQSAPFCTIRIYEYIGTNAQSRKEKAIKHVSRFSVIQNRIEQQFHLSQTWTSPIKYLRNEYCVKRFFFSFLLRHEAFVEAPQYLFDETYGFILWNLTLLGFYMDMHPYKILRLESSLLFPRIISISSASQPQLVPSSTQFSFLSPLTHELYYFEVTNYAFTLTLHLTGWGCHSR